ncbi:MAG: hypothetical protein JWR10_2154 [Rubritepida sp.]|nr:hypothetical protein [Rubritepida sp.]
MATSTRFRGPILGFALFLNLIVLAYFKYYLFFAAEISRAAGFDVNIATIYLPIGISFYTFTQIAFLVDTYHDKVKELNFIHYLLFVTYFPHLIAGPILHHAEMMQQFRTKSIYRLKAENISVGLTIFIIGLFKKVVLADGIAPFVGPIFDAPAGAAAPGMAAAWVGALAYTLQLYFDFSGYSDMAIGLSRMFGIILPLNFASPYKAESIIEFWRRWHMTLSRFLRDYLYFALGGSHRGTARRYANLFITMLLGGIWHGAGWTFLLWGAVHGVLLTLNHAFRAVAGGTRPASARPAWIRAAFVLGTFILVTMAWVLFRAPDVTAAFRILSSMVGWHGFEGSVPLNAACGSGYCSPSCGSPRIRRPSCATGGRPWRCRKVSPLC